MDLWYSFWIPEMVSLSVNLYAVNSFFSLSNLLSYKLRILTKLLGSPTSIAFVIVDIVFCFLYLPVFINLGTVSFSFVVAIKWETGSPIFFASIPAQRLPKFPLGTEKTTFKFSVFKFLYAIK